MTKFSIQNLSFGWRWIAYRRKPITILVFSGSRYNLSARMMIFGGSNSLTIPEPLQVRENDDHIERLYERVMRTMQPCEQLTQEADQLPVVALDWRLVH
jgi:hypothetical protein